MPYRPRSKYKAVKTVVDGITFDSRKEAKRYIALRELEKAGEIHDLRRQVRYTLIPEQRLPDVVGPRGGITKGKLLERECSYVADFVYTLPDGGTVIEDCKGFRTPEYKLKRKLMLWLHGVSITET